MSVVVVKRGTLTAANDGGVVLSGWEFRSPDGVDINGMIDAAIKHEAERLYWDGNDTEGTA